MFRTYVRHDFEECCAHCQLHELWRGGDDSFEIDHFRPKDDKLFPERRRDFYNLYWSCKRCNKRKENQWPSDIMIARGIGFVDLCQDTFDMHYVVKSDGQLESLTPSGDYTIKSLRLNSDHLSELRVSLIKEGKPFDRRP